MCISYQTFMARSPHHTILVDTHATDPLLCAAQATCIPDDEAVGRVCQPITGVEHHTSAWRSEGNIRVGESMQHPDQAAVHPRWQQKLANARAATAARDGTAKILIEVAAQHPLIDGVTPGEEFSVRLRYSVDLFRRCTAEGTEVEIYVPGSRLMVDGVEDKISLSAAGCAFLRADGIPDRALHGDDLNDRYKGPGTTQPGVCCSADECYVAACYWRDGGFGRLLSIVSVGQMHRKLLHFLEFGVYPFMHTVPTFVIAHDPIHEAMQMIPSVLYEDPDLQAPNSEQGIAFRRTRLPGYAAARGLT